MKRVTIAYIGFALSLASLTVNAGVKCTGLVTGLAIGPKSSILQVNNGYGWHYLCKFSAEYNGVHPDTCKAWYSMFLTAKASGKQVSQYYDNGTVCENVGSWKVPTPFPYFVLLEN
ncbi:MAG: hypothetical protein GY820_07450 [Gammaproteobacteria bacterium]|nr:hypothetical protein [Gammaproteobacteria bacterium]